MNISVKDFDFIDESLKGNIPLAVFVFSNKLNEIPVEIFQDEYVETIYNRMLLNKEFKGEQGELIQIQSIKSPFNRFILIGMGEQKNLELETFRVAGALVCRTVKSLNLKSVTVKFPDSNRLEEISQVFMEGLMLRNYEFNKYLQKKDESKLLEELYIYSKHEDQKDSIKKGLEVGRILSNATNICRDIANEPANYMTPEKMANKASEIAEINKQSLSCRIYSKEELEELGMGCFLGVAKGCSKSVPPRMIVMEYHCNDKNAPLIAFVGKGVTFDSGGISLKNAQNMFHMKRDMSGASAVIGIMKGVAELKLNVNVIGVIGATENMPSSNALKPGDIIKSMSGKTVEVINTDAEGRLVLADLLTFVQKKYKPTYIIDIATLTGAVASMFGGKMSGAFTNSRELIKKIMEASKKSNELIWELPLDKKLFKDANKSFFADLKNSSAKPPGAIKAGLFLYEFIENEIPWLHLDIAGADTSSGETATYYPRGSTGVSTRTMIEFLRNISES